MANGLRALGLNPGDRVALAMPMVPEILPILYGSFKAGLTAVPIFAGFGTDAIAARLADSGARVLFTAVNLERRGKTIPLLGKMPGTVERTIVLRRGGGDATGHLTWEDFLYGQSDTAPTASLDADACALLLYTSGTAGKPKGTVHTHAGVLAQTGKEIWLGFDHRAADRFFWLSAIGWMMGPWPIVGNHLFGGAVFLYDGAPDYPHPHRLWDIVERHGITTLGVSPTAVRLLAKSAGALPPMESLRLLGSQANPGISNRGSGFSRAWGGAAAPSSTSPGARRLSAASCSRCPFSR